MRGTHGPRKLSDETISALADKFGTSADELKSKLDSGENTRAILDSSGLSREDIRAAFEEAFTLWQSYRSTDASASTSTPEFKAVDVQVSHAVAIGERRTS